MPVVMGLSESWAAVECGSPSEVLEWAAEQPLTSSAPPPERAPGSARGDPRRCAVAGRECKLGDPGGRVHSPWSAPARLRSSSATRSSPPRWWTPMGPTSSAACASWASPCAPWRSSRMTWMPSSTPWRGPAHGLPTSSPAGALAPPTMTSPCAPWRSPWGVGWCACPRWSISSASAPSTSPRSPCASRTPPRGLCSCTRRAPGSPC
jgi:hypothetical protein